MIKNKVALLIILLLQLTTVNVSLARDRYGSNSTKGSGNGFTIFVAASNATSKAMASANYVCDGTNDEVQIQDAIDTAIEHNNFANVRLSEGTFNIGATIYHCGTPAHLAGGVGVAPSVWLSGSGVKNTQLNLTANVNMFAFGRYEQTIFSGISDMLCTGDSINRSSGSWMNYIYEGTGATDVDLLFDFNLRNIFIQDFRDTGLRVEGQSWGWILDNIIIEFCGRHVRPSDGVTPGVTSQALDASYVHVTDGGFTQWKLTGHTFAVGDVISIVGALGTQGLKCNGFWSVRAVSGNLFTISQGFDTYTQTGDESIISDFSHGMEVKDCAFGPKINACKMISNEGCGLLVSDNTQKIIVRGSEFNGAAESTPGIAVLGGNSNQIKDNRFVLEEIDGIVQACGVLVGPYGTSDPQLALICGNTFNPTKTTDQYCCSMDRSSFYSNISANTYNTFGTPTTTVDLRITGTSASLHSSIKTDGSNSTKFSSSGFP